MDMLQELKALWEAATYAKAVDLLLMWDQWTVLPPQGGAFRAKLSGHQAAKGAELLKSDRARLVYEHFYPQAMQDMENDTERAVVRAFLTQYRRVNAVPSHLVSQSAALCHQAQEAWVQAKAAGDYALFKPWLEKQFAMQIEIAGAIDPHRPPLEVLMGGVDEDFSLEQVKGELAKVARGVADLVKRIQASKVHIDDSFLPREYDRRVLLEYAKALAQRVGYDLAKGAFGEVPHPFTCMVGPKDARITANSSSFKLGVFGTIHEAGHAMYAYGGSLAVDEANLWGGIQGSFHESQSRFYENLIAKSRAFWVQELPRAAGLFPSLKGVSLDDFYRAINRVEPSLQRITADEVTYSLHPIIRFELEEEIFGGRLSLDELPRAWGDKYEAYLGIRPQNDAEGLMQDIHWAAGSMAYFQSYTLGNLIGAQLRETMLEAVPRVYEDIAAGDFTALNRWLGENIHQYGAMYPPGAMLARVTGKPLSAQPFLDYLNEKYADIYHLS